MKPEKGKWTKLGPCLDWRMVSGIIGIFRKVFPIAFQRLGLKTVVGGDDDAYLIDVDWHAVMGSRVSKVRQGLADPMMFSCIIILAIVLEPIRWFTRWFLVRASTVRRLKH